MNDMLVAALHMAVDGWNAEHGVRTRRISLLMPVNLRPQAWKTDVVTNYVMESRVFTTPADRRTPQGILEAVMAQTRRIKDGEGAALFELLRHSPKLPLWIKRRLSGALWATTEAADGGDVAACPAPAGAVEPLGRRPLRRAVQRPARGRRACGPGRRTTAPRARRTQRTVGRRGGPCWR